MSEGKILCVLFAVFLALGTLSACNTMEGFGKDLEQVGENIQDEAG